MEQPNTPLPLQWTNAQRILFRFFFTYFLLYIFFNPNGVVPGSDAAFEYYIQPFHRLIPWIAQHILHLSKKITVFTNGSGDTTYDNIVLLFLTVLAILTCLVWTLLDRKRRSYNILFYWLTTIIRYYLGITMLYYGYAKVFKLQFPAPGLGRLLETYGESSPMGLAWTYMGYSTGYNLFTGLAEVTAGFLLLFRRTTAIGAFLAFIVSANIMAMNMSFDIPVKLLSTTMVLMSLFLLGENIRRLFGLFFLGRTTRLSIVASPRIKKKALRISLIVLKSLIVLYVVIGSAVDSIKTMHTYGDHAPHPPLYGIYNIQLFRNNKDTLPALQTDTIRWKQLVIDGSANDPYAMLKMMNDTLTAYSLRIDTTQRVLMVSDFRDSTKKWRLHYRPAVKDSLVLWGSRFRGKQADSVSMVMVRYPAERFWLTSRGFNWINEFPYNR
jgi:uncharacterized membrane protein YphA (DoxX/SURF4 family)